MCLVGVLFVGRGVSFGSLVMTDAKIIKDLVKSINDLLRMVDEEIAHKPRGQKTLERAYKAIANAEGA